MKNIGFKIDDELYKQLKLICVMKDISLKQMIINLITEFIENERKSEK